MVAVSPFKIAVICLCLVSIAPFLLQVKKESKPKQKGTLVSNSHPSLGFNNQTGDNVTQIQISSFVNFINSASTYFRDDTKARLDYISDQMNKAYAIDGYGFSVIQQGNQSYWSWAIYNYYDVYATVAPGVDKVFPAQSYMFIMEPKYSSGRVYFQTLGMKGIGITSTLQTVIKNTILSIDNLSTCYCSGTTRDIASKLNAFDGGAWNVFCSSNYITFALNVYVYSDKYIYIKPKNCYYGIYEK